MQQLYFESRRLSANPPTTLATDMARHLQMRQYLGTSVVICDNPTSLLSAVRKQWLKAARYLQRLRASTLNAEEILRLTHAIMHMQNMQFVAKTPVECPGATVFFVTPDDPITEPPLKCYSVYFATEEPLKSTPIWMQKLQAHSLVVSYADKPPLANGLLPKEQLEQHVMDTWHALTRFLARHGVHPRELIVGDCLQFSAMDEALDTLLGISNEFLLKAAHFQHTINLAQPLTAISSKQQKQFEAITRLAHRTQSLTPGNFDGYLMTTFGDSGTEMFFLRDVGSELYADLEIEAAAAIGRPSPGSSPISS